jgi:hypothetical protein
MPKDKNNHRESLTAGFPWLSDEMAHRLVSRLTDADLRKFQEELHEAELSTRRRFARDIVHAGRSSGDQILTAYAVMARTD